MATARRSEIAGLFRARGDDFTAVCRAADELRCETNGDVVSYVVTRNINYTNICSFKCQFCAFSKGKMSENLRGRPYDLDMREVADHVIEAWQRGASEVCMQGGIHPSYTGQKYLDICRTVKDAVPQIHMHAFSPLEIYQGAQTLGIPVTDFLRELKAAGLDTLPGTAAEILDDEVRVVLCADKIRTQQWLDVMRAAHSVGFRSTATIMFGHIEDYRHWARHLLRDAQPAIGDRRLHRIRAAAIRSHGSADLSQGAGAAGSDVSRSDPDACGGAPRAQSAHSRTFRRPG